MAIPPTTIIERTSTEAPAQNIPIPNIATLFASLNNITPPPLESGGRRVTLHEAALHLIHPFLEKAHALFESADLIAQRIHFDQGRSHFDFGGSCPVVERGEQIGLYAFNPVINLHFDAI
jgi:hypothetical protein